MRNYQTPLPPKRVPKDPQGHQPDAKSKSAWKPTMVNKPKGMVLPTMFRNGLGTWKIQMVAVGPTPETRKPIFRFQLWAHPENGGMPIKEGPCGFTLNMPEVKKLINSLTEALRQAESGEFNLLDDNNALPPMQSK
jgi:hypothetical protein